MKEILHPERNEQDHKEVWKGVAGFLAKNGYREEMTAIRDHQDNTPDATQLQLLGAAASNEAKQQGHGREYYYIKNWALLRAAEAPDAEYDIFPDQNGQEAIALRTQGSEKYRGIVTVHHVDSHSGMANRPEFQSNSWKYTEEWRRQSQQNVPQSEAKTMLRSQLALENPNLIANKIREAAPPTHNMENESREKEPGPSR